nr:peptidylprolyl isomerase [Ardenticatena sp.]
MAKRRAEQPKAPTRKQLSRAQKEAELQRRIILGSALLLGAVVIILLAGFIYDQFVAPRQPIATVDNTSITVEAYQKRVNYERYRLYSAIDRTGQQLLQFNPNDTSVAFLLNMYSQQLNQLVQQYQSIPLDVLETMIEETLMREKAAELGVTVSNEEVDTRLRQIIATQLNAITQADADATATAVAQRAATQTAEAAAATPRPTSVMTETESITSTTPITPTATPFPTPTPNILTEEAFRTGLENYLKAIDVFFDFTEADLREIVFNEVLREKVREAVIADVPTEEEQVNLRALLLPDEESAQQALAELRAGKSMEAVANELSGTFAGDLGWVSRGQTVPEFEEAAFSLDEGAISEPVQTEFGWHILQVLERDEENDRVRVRHILVETEEEAQQVRERLLNGEAFADVAREVSQDTGSLESIRPLELGWVVRDQEGIPDDILKAAFELSAGEYSDPLPLGDGRFVILYMVEGPEVRELPEDVLRQRQQNAFETWLAQVKGDAEIDRNWDESKVPDDPFADDIALILQNLQNVQQAFQEAQQEQQAQPTATPTP